MELAVITDEISQDLDHALAVMAEYGIRAAELRGVWGVNIVDADDELVQRVATTIGKYGAKVVGIASPVYKCDLPGFDGEARNDGHDQLFASSSHDFNDQITVLKRAISIAETLQAPFVRVFTFWKKGPLTVDVESAVVDSFLVPAELAKDAGKVLLIENEHACYYGTGIDTARLLAKIDSAYVRSVWDPGNAFMAGERPFPDGYDAIKDYVAHVHVKDGNNDGQWTVLGEGAVDWSGQMTALRKSGYDGFLALETHYNGGGDPESSSRQCLVGLKRLYEDFSS